MEIDVDEDHEQAEEHEPEHEHGQKHEHEHEQRGSGPTGRGEFRHEDLSGLVRRVRRSAQLSQRGLAHVLGVSQSAVAKWETGRTAPSTRMLTRILDVASLGLVVVRDDGERVQPMKAVAATDAAGRRYPAHTFVWPEGWWVPQGAETTAWFTQILRRSAELELPRVRYSRTWQLPRRPSVADLQDHPTWAELVAEAKEGWQPPRRKRLAIPDWALQDTRKSRGRARDAWPPETPDWWDSRRQ